LFIFLTYTEVILNNSIIFQHDYTNCSLYRVDPPDDEQQACSKHLETYY